ncbi:2967_t:CDS:2 [Diversispora eburnea]|uniref:2967_t:CDS:1 n=1 Tax=Diversispora eburnea TaxID=1213867 RepID=A0A9N9BPA3_9GLOM|nr:2967_t:CDS:2 [Diversispora eburnea]
MNQLPECLYHIPIAIVPKYLELIIMRECASINGRAPPDLHLF